MAGFPPQRKGILYLAEGGQETEIMYRHGHQLPEFAMYPLLDNPVAVADLKEMYRRMLDVAAEHRFVPMMSGLDYRASPDWGDKLGYSRSALADALDASITLLRDVAKPYEDQIDEILIGGMLGPRGDAYSLNRTITAEQARSRRLRECHDVQQCSRSDRRVSCRSTDRPAAQHVLYAGQQSSAQVRAQP